MNKSLYLAGPIGNCTFDEAVDWRRVAQQELKKNGIDAYSPMRGKDYLDTGERITGGSYPYALSTSKGIMARDYHDATTCDLLLVNLSIPHERISIGTVMELGFAFAKQKLVVAIDSPVHQYQKHPMVAEAVGFWAKDLTEAMEIARKVLNP